MNVVDEMKHHAQFYEYSLTCGGTFQQALKLGHTNLMELPDHHIV
jgi:hypothetical protein